MKRVILLLVVLLIGGLFAGAAFAEDSTSVADGEESMSVSDAGDNCLDGSSSRADVIAALDQIGASDDLRSEVLEAFDEGHSSVDESFGDPDSHIALFCSADSWRGSCGDCWFWDPRYGHMTIGRRWRYDIWCFGFLVSRRLGCGYC